MIPVNDLLGSMQYRIILKIITIYPKNHIRAFFIVGFFYYLKMIDLDQTFTYSRIQSLQFAEKAVTVSVYPNQVSDVLFIRDVLLETVKSIMINDLNSKIIYQANSIKNEGIPVGNMVSGMYLLQVIQRDGTRSSRKAIISR